jgi:hypothetical protein
MLVKTGVLVPVSAGVAVGGTGVLVAVGGAVGVGGTGVPGTGLVGSAGACSIARSSSVGSITVHLQRHDNVQRRDPDSKHAGRGDQEETAHRDVLRL